MQNLPTFQRCKFGTCELCGGFYYRGGVTGLVKNRSEQDVMPVRQVFICDPCLEQIGTVEENEHKIKDELLGDCLAPLKGLGKLEQVQLDGGEIEPENIKPKDWLKFDEDGHLALKGAIKITTLHAQPIRPHPYDPDELKSKVEQLQLLRGIEKEAQLNAEALKQQFEKDPLLLKVYLSSAEYVMEKVGKAIDDLIGGLL